MNHRPNVIVDAAIEVLRDGRMRTAAELSKELVTKIDRTPATISTTISVHIAHDPRFKRERRRVRKGFSVYYYGLADGEVA